MDFASLNELSFDKKQQILDLLQPILLKNLYSDEDFRFKSNLGLFELFSSLESLIKQEQKVKLFKINDMFAPHNNQNIQQNSALNAFNISQRIEGEISYLLEQQPDATFQVKYKPSEKTKTLNEKIDDIVFSEYYELQYPEQTKIRLCFQEFQILKIELEIKTFYEFLMHILISYNQFVYSQITSKNPENSNFKALDLTWQFSLDEKRDSLFSKDLFPLYLILKIRGLFQDFQSQIQAKINNSSNFTPCRINIISFLNIFISHILDSMSGSKKETKEKFLPLNNGNLFNIMTVFLENSILKSLILKILNKILIDENEVLKIIRGIYIEFKEKDQADLHEKENCEDLYLKGLDKLFRFTKTNYFIYKYMLIIEFQVVKMHENFDEIKSEFKENPVIIDDYFFMVTNKFEFYENIFNNEQIINTVLGKLELENLMLDISKNFSSLASKTMTISINFDSLLNILKKEFFAIKTTFSDRYAKILKYQQLWNLIHTIKEYFVSRAERDLIDETKDSNYDDNFHIIYLQMISAFHDQKSLNEIFMRNYHKYSIAENIDKDFKTLSIENSLQLFKIPLNSKEIARHYFQINEKNENLFK